jgi:hypothetical protein
VLFCVQNKYKKNPAVPNPYCTDLLTLLAASKSVLSLCLGNRATSLLKNPFSENGNFLLLLALSQSLNLSKKE